MLRFDGVTYQYPGSPAPALEAASFEVVQGEHVALVGANGSGKTTLARLCNGLLVPTVGSVTIDGLSTRDEEDAYRVRSQVAFVAQNPDDQIVGTVVEEDVAFGPENLGVPPEEIRRRVDAAIEAVGLVGRERFEPHLLSEGQKQRLAIAGALAMMPRYFVLDEPTALLDPAGRASVMAIIEDLVRRGHGVIHVTHDLTEALHARRVIALREGRIVYDGDPWAFVEDGALVASLALEMPPIITLEHELRAGGAAVPLTLVPSEVVEALCR